MIDLTHRENYCSCVKPEGQWGQGGFHLRRDPKFPDSRPRDIVVERCPAYLEACRERAVVNNRLGQLRADTSPKAWTERNELDKRLAAFDRVIKKLEGADGPPPPEGKANGR